MLQQPKYRQQRPVGVQHLPEVGAVSGDVAEGPQGLLLEGRIRRRQEADELRGRAEDCPGVAAVAAGDVRETPSRTRFDAQIRNVGCQKAKAEACVGSPRTGDSSRLVAKVRSFMF